MIQQPISCAYTMTSHLRDKYKVLNGGQEIFSAFVSYLLSHLNDQSASRKDPIPPTEPPFHWSARGMGGLWRSEAITERLYEKLVGQFIAATKHFCQTSGLRDTERFCLLFLLGFFGRFSWVQLCCDRLVLCLYSWSHLTHIYYSNRNLQSCCFLLLWSPPGLSPARSHWNFTLVFEPSALLNDLVWAASFTTMKKAPAVLYSIWVSVNL